MALMSCGPAFMSLVAESFADAGAAHGLAAEDARRMTVETMAGTAAWLGAPRLRPRGPARARGHARRRHRARAFGASSPRASATRARAAVDAVVEGTR